MPGASTRADSGVKQVSRSHSQPGIVGHGSLFEELMSSCSTCITIDKGAPSVATPTGVNLKCQDGIRTKVNIRMEKGHFGEGLTSPALSESATIAEQPRHSKLCTNKYSLNVHLLDIMVNNKEKMRTNRGRLASILAICYSVLDPSSTLPFPDS